MTPAPLRQPLIVDAAIEWAYARRAMLELPQGSPEFRGKLNALSEAEDALRKAVEDRHDDTPTA